MSIADWLLTIKDIDFLLIRLNKINDVFLLSLLKKIGSVG